MRKISDKLLDRLIKGDLLPLLTYIKSDKELRLEVRRKGDAFVYYRKGKVLAIKGLKIGKQYGDVPKADLAKTNPKEYFTQIKEVIDKWLDTKKKRAEFDTQQNIAKNNQDINDRYIILDMEYAFKQEQIEKNNREKDKTAFDLLGIERETNRIVFFEVKTGMRATKGKSGIDDHIKKFGNYFSGKNSEIFMTNLIMDIKNIIEDKTKLGILDNFYLPDAFKKHKPEFVFVFHPDNESETQEFLAKLGGRHKLMIVNDNNNYKLK